MGDVDRARRASELTGVHRFFVSPEAIQQGVVRFTESQAHQFAHVLRLRPGDQIIALDNSGWQYVVELVQVDATRAVGQVKTKMLAQTEPRTKITLYQALLRPSKFEVVLQKCTELGVAAFVPTISERCIISNVGDGNPAKLERWHRIIVEAAEQSNRGKLPTLQPASMFPQAAEQARGFSLVAWEGESERSIRDVVREGLGVGVAGARRPFTVNVFIGPEGGFSAAEVEIARSYGIVPVSLGRRILRAETAAIAATTIILYEAGDLG